MLMTKVTKVKNKHDNNLFSTDLLASSMVYFDVVLSSK